MPVTALLATAGGLWVESVVCCVAFGWTSAVIPKTFQSCWSSPFLDLLLDVEQGFVGALLVCAVGVSGLLTSLFKPVVYEATTKPRELTGLLFIGS